MSAPEPRRQTLASIDASMRSIAEDQIAIAKALDVVVDRLITADEATASAYRDVINRLDVISSLLVQGRRQ
jgi:hypothetical protein